MRDNKQISSHTLIALVGEVLKNNIFEFDGKTFKQVRKPTTAKSFAPPYVILFLTNLKGKILNAFEKKFMMLEVHRRHCSYLGTWRKISGKIFNKLNSFHSTIKFTAEYSNETIHFLDVNVRLVGELTANFKSSSHPYQCKKVIHLIKL